MEAEDPANPDDSRDLVALDGFVESLAVDPEEFGDLRCREDLRVGGGLRG